MLLKEDTSIGINEFWNLNQTINDQNNDKHTKPVYSLIPKGNFRSNLLESWETSAPDEVGYIM